MDIDKIYKLVEEGKPSELAVLVSMEIFSQPELINHSKEIMYKHAIFICPALEKQINKHMSKEEVEERLKGLIKINVKMILHSEVIYPSDWI